MSSSTASGIDYNSYYKSHDVAPSQLLIDINWLRSEKQFADIEKAITAYLTHRGKRAESWMYCTLAVTMEMNDRDPAQVLVALGWAAYLARNERDAVALIRVADLMMLRNFSEVGVTLGPGKTRSITTGELLDLACELAPQLPQPILMSMKLAQSSQDSKRMASAVECLLSLGWPGYDAVWRLDAERQVDALVKTLTASGRSEDAQELRSRVAESLTRDLVIRLTWTGDAGLDLVVEEPLGARADHFNPRTVFGGALIKEGRGSKHREAIYVCPRAFDGEYKILADVFYNDEKNPVKTATVEIITHEGRPEEHRQTRSISLLPPQPILVKLEGGRRKSVLPFQAPASTIPDSSQTPERVESTASRSQNGPAPSGENTPRAAPAAKPAAKHADPLDRPANSKTKARPINPEKGTGVPRP